MFQISLDMTEMTLTGMNALDMRRRLKMSDNSFVRFVDSRTVTTNVDESFARKHFHPDHIAERAVVPISLLAPGDVTDDGPEKVVFRDDLSHERIKELWLLSQ